MQKFHPPPLLFPAIQVEYLLVRKDIVVPETLQEQASLTGRQCSIFACEKLGVAHAVIGKDAQGRPLFPTGIVGSISHSDAYGIAMAGTEIQWKSLGIDIEPVTPSARQVEAIEKKILTPEERRKWGGDFQAILALFTLKEAAFKCMNWLHPCRTNSFEITKWTKDELTICLRGGGPALPLLAYTEMNEDLQHRVSMVALSQSAFADMQIPHAAP